MENSPNNNNDDGPQTNCQNDNTDRIQRILLMCIDGASTHVRQLDCVARNGRLVVTMQPPQPELSQFLGNARTHHNYSLSLFPSGKLTKLYNPAPPVHRADTVLHTRTKTPYHHLDHGHGIVAGRVTEPRSRSVFADVGNLQFQHPTKNMTVLCALCTQTVYTHAAKVKTKHTHKKRGGAKRANKQT